MTTNVTGVTPINVKATGGLI